MLQPRAGLEVGPPQADGSCLVAWRRMSSSTPAYKQHLTGADLPWQKLSRCCSSCAQSACVFAGCGTLAASSSTVCTSDQGSCVLAAAQVEVLQRAEEAGQLSRELRANGSLQMAAEAFLAIQCQGLPCCNILLCKQQGARCFALKLARHLPESQVAQLIAASEWQRR